MCQPGMSPEGMPEPEPPCDGGGTGGPGVERTGSAVLKIEVDAALNDFGSHQTRADAAQGEADRQTVPQHLSSAERHGDVVTAATPGHNWA